MKMRRPRQGFTLAELLVSIGVLALILVMLASVVTGVASSWKRVTTRVSSFEEARAGFESMTRKLSQAMLNSYYDYEDANGKTFTGSTSQTFVPTAYLRQSDLHFVSNVVQSLALTGSYTSGLWTDAMFFQAPLGYTAKVPVNSGGSTAMVAPTLGGLLNATGYFIEHTTPTAVPKFFQSLPSYSATAKRYQLMELWCPTESMEEYNDYQTYLANPTTTTAAYLKRWYMDPINAGYARVLSQDVIALIIIPKLAVGDPGNATYGTSITYNNTYQYNTRLYTSFNASLGTAAQIYSVGLERNQLPPMVQVTMVAIDEPSAVRLEALGTASKTYIFLNNYTTYFANPANYTTDLASLVTAMGPHNDKLNYRIYSSDVTIRQAKWNPQ